MFSAGMEKLDALAYAVPEPDELMFHPANVKPTRVGSVDDTVTVAPYSSVDAAGAPDPPLAL